MAIGQEPGLARHVVVRRWIARRRARLLEGFAAASAAAFVVLALAVQRGPGLAVDLAITRAVQQLDGPGLRTLMVAISAPGFWPWNWLSFGVAAVGLWLAGFRREVLFLALTPGAGLISGLTKALVERPRPSGDGVQVVSQLLDFSYPSGHVVGYVSFYGFLFFLAYVLFRQSGWRTAALIVLGLLVVLVGPSRLYLGHHWASDVLGGYGLGTAYLVVVIEAYRRTAHLAGRTPQPDSTREPATSGEPTAVSDPAAG